LSRFSQLIDSDSNEDSVHIPGSTADVPSSESGISEVPSDYDAPAQTDDDDSLHSAVDTSGVHDGMLSDNEREGVHDVYAARNVLRDRWNTTRGDKTYLDENESDGDTDLEDPVVDADDNDEDEHYVDWAAIEAESGLSAWDKLGESFEQDVAAIGML